VQGTLESGAPGLAAHPPMGQRSGKWQSQRLPIRRGNLSGIKDRGVNSI